MGADLTVCLSVGLLVVGTGGLTRLVGPLKSRFRPGGFETEGSISTSPSPNLKRVFNWTGLDSALGTGGFHVGLVIRPVWKSF